MYKNKKNKKLKIEENNNDIKPKENNCFPNFVVFCFLSLIVEIIYYISVHSFLNEKNNQLSTLNFKKYLNQKDVDRLFDKLNECLLTKYSYDEEIKEKENQIKMKDDNIKLYKKMASNLIQNYSATPEMVLKLKKENENKMTKIKELNLILNNSTLRRKFNTKIIDNTNEFDSIRFIKEKIILNKLNEFKLCYRGENNKINILEASEKCGLNKDIPFLFLIENDKYERYGIYLSTEEENQSFSFQLNGLNLKISDIKLKNYQWQNLDYIYNIIQKEYYHNNKSFKFIINSLEIFYL